MLNRNRPSFQGVVLPVHRVRHDAPRPLLRSLQEVEARVGQRTYRLIRYEQIRALAAGGMSRRAIARHFGISRGTVDRYFRAARFPERARPRPFSNIRAPFITYLEQRWSEGCEYGLQLCREVRARGYPGSPTGMPNGSSSTDGSRLPRRGSRSGIPKRLSGTAATASQPG